MMQPVDWQMNAYMAVLLWSHLRHAAYHADTALRWQADNQDRLCMSSMIEAWYAACCNALPVP